MRFLHQLNEHVDRFLYRPDLSPRVLMQKKLSWIWTVSAGGGVLVMTLFAWVMSVWTLVWFGVALLVLYAIVIPLFRYVRDFERLNFYFLLAVISAAFLTILKLGGITHSMGLVFVGLACAMASALDSSIKRAVITFAFYAATIIVAGLLQPYLTVAPEATPSKNLLFHVVNIVWISGSTLNFIVDFMKQRSHLEEEKSLRLKELNEAKTRLYTNITHEFRTPLTIILGMAQQIKENSKTWLNTGLELITRNGQRLLTLVNQMLDLQKLDAGMIMTQPFQADVVPFLAYLTHSFSMPAESKNIHLAFHPELDAVVMDYDPEKLQNIVSNLLSNALKFTPNGGSVYVRLTASEPEAGANRYLSIVVEDSGIGISPDHLPFIFDRFYQAENETTRYSSGTGIGLALTKELVKLMDGDISVTSEVGQGTSFLVKLPITHNAPVQDVSLGEIPAPVISLPSAGFTEISENQTDRKHPLVLVAEDNQDMVRYLDACLLPDFRLATAFDGKQALEKALEIIPDLVISDVMMPEMDGFGLCERLKNDFRTSHIPIVMLTAKADMASRIEGLECGADAYLTKPFYKEELLAHLHNLIELRKKLSQRYASHDPPSPTEDKAIQREDLFMHQVRSIMKTHLSDENFGIPQLCQELAMSRAQLYRKFEALTNVPVGKFIRTLRLRKAKELLENSSLNVTEVAFEVGFRNLSHFSTAFKEEFGVSPSEAHH